MTYIWHDPKMLELLASEAKRVDAEVYRYLYACVPLDELVFCETYPFENAMYGRPVETDPYRSKIPYRTVKHQSQVEG